ncbi:MAG: hypothetical protein HUJ51_05250 [Eggerthellaceae bacterium]|nr:hypothetical protein [Eggerthellaceae bacterium]
MSLYHKKHNSLSKERIANKSTLEKAKKELEDSGLSKKAYNFSKNLGFQIIKTRTNVGAKVKVVSSSLCSKVKSVFSNIDNKIKSYNPGIRQGTDDSPIFYAIGNPMRSSRVNDLSGSEGIFRNQDFHKRNKTTLAAALCVALVFSLFMLFQWTNVKLADLRSSAAAIAQYANKKVDYNFPNLADLVDMTDMEIMDIYSNQEIGIIDLNSNSISNNQNLNIYKPTPNLSQELLNKVIAQDFKSMSSIELIQVLNGSWNLTTERSGAFNIRLRYSDFSSKSIGSAFQNCLIVQGIECPIVKGNGVDENDNNFQYGTLTINKKNYIWRISINCLRSVYSQTGIPGDGFYVVYKLEEKTNT